MLLRNSAKHKFPNHGNWAGFSLPKTNVDFFFIKSNLSHLVHSWYKWLYFIMPTDIIALSAGLLETLAWNMEKHTYKGSMWIENGIILFTYTAKLLWCILYMPVVHLSHSVPCKKYVFKCKLAKTNKHDKFFSHIISSVSQKLSQH